jgi:hypothetical protein
VIIADVLKRVGHRLNDVFFADHRHAKALSKRPVWGGD